MVEGKKSNKTVNYEDEYYLLYPSDITIYPLIYEECRRLPCSYEKYKDCEKTPDCHALYMKKRKIDNPQRTTMDFITTYTNKPVIYADCYMPLSLSGSSFVVSSKLYGILYDMHIEGIQLIPAVLLEDNNIKYIDFVYVHTFNFLPVLSFTKSRFQMSKGKRIRNNILEIGFLTSRMNKINLDNRLIFRFPINRNYFIFHFSVVDKLLAVNPVGLQFVKISEVNFPDIDGILI